jgi:hypothetical protein
VRTDSGRLSIRPPWPVMISPPDNSFVDFDCFFPRTGYNNGPFGE